LTTAAFLEQVKRLGVELAADGDRLRCTAPTGVLTPQLRVEIEKRKPEILATLAEERKAPPASPSQAIPRLPRGEAMPLSFAQRRLWFLARLAPGNPFYNVPAALRLSGRLDPEALERSLQAIVRRHESLRTTFVEQDGEPIQAIAPGLGVTLDRLDLEDLAAAEQEAAVLRLAQAEARQAFDLALGPLLRARLVRLGEREHVLLLLLHHIICDNWSMQVILAELLAFYSAPGGGVPALLREPPVQYADYAAWQQRRLRGPEMSGELAYWRERLAGSPEFLALPTDHPRPSVQTHRGAQHRFHLPADLVEPVRALGRREGATLFMTLLTAYGALLGRYSDQEDLVVGTPIAGRTRADLEGVVGCFANTLALRLNLAGAPTFRALLRQVREVCLGAYAHQEVPFEQLVETLAPPRSLDHAPLAQTMFQLLNAPAASLTLPGLRIVPLPVDTGTAKFDLTLFLREAATGLDGLAEYSTDLFEADTITRMADHYATLLRGAAAEPDARIDELPLIGDGERRRLLVEWNATRAAYPEGLCLHRLIAAQAARTPDAVAVVFEGAQLTYAELHARAGRLSQQLRRLGVGADVLVGLCLERSLELVVALLAVLEAGGAYLPLEPGYPRERLADMVADAAPDVILTHAPVAARLPELGKTPVLIFTADGTIASVGSAASAESTTAPPAGTAAASATAQVSATEADKLAYVLYTSGSTGRPKGVMISHRGVCNRLLWMQEAHRLTPADRVLQKTPFSFDVSVWEFFWPLMTGARLVVARPGGHQDPAYLTRLVAKQRITVLHFVPSMLEAFLQEPGLEESCATLRRIICSGEVLSPRLQETCLARLPHAELHNLYGPTEASIDVTAWRCEPKGGREVVPIGRPIANMQVYVLDRQMRPAPVGVPGDLYLAGVGLARGYLKRPELTALCFVPHPFGAPGARLYRTGDRARWRADGTLEYLGRLDGQLKVRGMRIELGEIETTLRQHVAVRDAAVVAHTVASGDVRLVAYVVPRPGAVLDPAEVGAALREGLPDHMLPAALVPLAEMPLSSNGKLDRRALPVPEWDRLAASGVAGAPPRTPVEATLARIWAEVLRVDRVGVDDDFFALGGHSLLAVQVVSRVRATLDVELQVRALFQKPRLADLAATIEALRPAGASRRVPAIQPLPRDASRWRLSSTERSR
jgi:amino acid adenylation domain-containing protein